MLRITAPGGLDLGPGKKIQISIEGGADKTIKWWALSQAYIMLVRNPEHFESLKNLTHSRFDWYQVKEELPFYLLQTGDFRARAQSVSCTQAIAGESALSTFPVSSDGMAAT